MPNPTRIAINGFGRMGRLVLRAAWDRDDLEIVHVNEPFGDLAGSAHLLAFDSVHGRWHDDDLAVDGDRIRIGERSFGYSMRSAPGTVRWSDLGVDIVLECSGKFRKAEQLHGHFEVGAERVIVSAPIKEGARNIAYGINHDAFDPRHDRLLTAASCTTNCLAPVVKVVHETFGIRHGCITTIHDATNTQVVVDHHHKDLRRARAAGLNLIPTTTGSATAIGLIYPELLGRLDGHAVRVPLLNASLTDAVFELEHDTTVEAVNAAFRTAAAGPLAGILAFEDRPLVSTDFRGDPHSATIDAASTMVTDGRLIKIYAWYDNEWGYVNRMADLAAFVGGR